MRITDIRTRRFALPLDPPFVAAWDPTPRRTFEATIVVVETDEGLTGVGSGDTMDGFDAYRHLFVGRDPMRIADHVRTLETVTFHGGRYWPLEAALWDIVGQACGQPVSVLFGNAADRLCAYASTGAARSPAERAEVALDLQAEGFRAMKIRIRRDRLAEGLTSVRAVRDAVGDSMDLMVDLNQAWRMPGDIDPSLDPVAVRRIADELAELGVLWLEEPLDGNDFAGLAALRAGSRVRIAGGEMVRTVGELLALLDADALDVYQHDVVLAVGLWRGRMVAELARARNRWFTPHTWSNGLGLVANLHVAAGVGAGPYLEFPTTRRPGTRHGGTSCSPSRSGSTRTATSPCPDGPGSVSTSTGTAWRRWNRTVEVPIGGVGPGPRRWRHPRRGAAATGGAVSRPGGGRAPG
ncbi:MAG: mandelate racemase/muconate lactonizing enzyme family protein [Actinomycetota bacterium]|nr:mandelate racemase/muconate lactonizing enzyme family protein [Actinomycetota bacterium]